MPKMFRAATFRGLVVKRLSIITDVPTVTRQQVMIGATRLKLLPTMMVTCEHLRAGPASINSLVIASRGAS